GESSGAGPAARRRKPNSAQLTRLTSGLPAGRPMTRARRCERPTRDGDMRVKVQEGWVELPEVEVVRRDLEKEVVGRRIKDVDVRPHRNAMRIIRRHARRKEFADLLTGRKVTKVDRKGKYLLLHLDDGDVLVVHFGMSGQFLRGTRRQSLPPHTH